jgi:hypothetical protein
MISALAGSAHQLPAERPPKLSVIVTGRNDDRCPHQVERLIGLQRTLAHSLRNVTFEFLFVEWNPEPGRPYLGEALFLDEARHFVVTREAHRRFVAEQAMLTRDGRPVKSERAFLLNHANGVGLKHASGDWVLITNIDNLFGPELGQFLETGWSPARAVGWQRSWGRWVLNAYVALCQSPVLGALLRKRQLMAAALRRVVKLGSSPLVLLVRAVRARLARQQLRRSSWLAHIQLKLRHWVLPPLASIRRRTARWRLAGLHWYARFRAGMVQYLLGRKIRGTRRIGLKPGIVYRVRRMEIDGKFACQAARSSSILGCISQAQAAAEPGPWNPTFPWTEACGDFMLMDRESWVRIGGFPKHLGQLHADSLTVFKLVNDGHPVALLDWNIYHIQHENRFDAVPYTNYDFVNPNQYFSPGWTSAEAIVMARSSRPDRSDSRDLVLAS